jgi:hypothetical protein
LNIYFTPSPYTKALFYALIVFLKEEINQKGVKQKLYSHKKKDANPGGHAV